jgi:hypothetical protein
MSWREGMDFLGYGNGTESENQGSKNHLHKASPWRDSAEDYYGASSPHFLLF